MACNAGEDVGHYGGSYKVTYDLHKKYGDFRLLDTPICGKQHPFSCTRAVTQPCLNLLALHSAEDLVLPALLQWTHCSLSSSICARQIQKDCLSHNAENGFVGMGIGAAMTGLRPVIEGMNMGFLLLAYNQISNNAGMLHYTSGGQFKVCIEQYDHMMV